jgi:hypothetical protein
VQFYFVKNSILIKHSRTLIFLHIVQINSKTACSANCRPLAHNESKGALYRKMNAECLQMTLDRRLWELFLRTIRIIAEMLDVDADYLLKMVMTNPDAEKLLNLFFENKLKEAC